MARTPEDFISLVRGKKFDIDGVYGAQCVDGFKRFCQYAGIKVYASGNNLASGYWKNRNKHGSSKHFEFISNPKDFKNGDWVVWDKNAFSGTHIAMYYNGQAFGQNQHQPESDRGFSFMNVSSKTMNKALGALRWKHWEYSGGSISPLDTSYETSDGSVSYQPMKVEIDPSIFQPYLLTLDRSSTLPKKKLKDIGVIGAAVEAGYLYTSSHTKASTYENPYTGAQIKALREQNMLYGWYNICRAKTSVEAKDEMYHFSFPVRRHPPKLGVWLKLELKNSKSINDGILETYKKELIRLGFVGKMGIMCERSMLKNISWDKWQDDFYLWLIEHVKNTSEISNLMDPVFFDIDGQG